jgi:hypothetical protein
MDKLTHLRDALERVAPTVTSAREKVTALQPLSSPADPDVFDRLREAAAHIARAEALLDALADDLAVWLDEEVGS